MSQSPFQVLLLLVSSVDLASSVDGVLDLVQGVVVDMAMMVNFRMI